LPDEAAADLLAIDRETALRLFDGILRFSRTGSGDLKALQGRYGRIDPPPPRRLPHPVLAPRRRHADLPRPASLRSLPLTTEEKDEERARSLR